MNALADQFTQGVYGLKPRFQNILRPTARRLETYGVRANQITITAIVASAAVGIFLASRADEPRWLLILPIFLLFRMALNALDGILAREFEQESTLGLYLNELGDVVSDGFCYQPFAFVHPFSPVWITAIIVLAVYTEVAGVLGPMANASRRYDGPMGKSDRAFVFGVLALWVGAGGAINATGTTVFSAAVVMLLAATVVNRIARGISEGAAPLTVPAEVVISKKRYLQRRYFTTHDGTRLFYRYWPAIQGTTGRAVVLLHRGHEHSGRLSHVVDELNLPGYEMFAWDARGHGYTAAPCAQEPTLGTFVKDLDRFVAHISQTYGIAEENIAIVSQSVGSVLAATWVHDYAPKIRCMVLVAPAFKVRLYVPFARTLLKWAHRLVGDFRVNSYVRPGVLTHDAERIASYKTDPFITRPISVRVLLGLYGTSERVLRDAQAITVPTQVLVASQDWVVDRRPQKEFFERLGTSNKEIHQFEGFYHDVLGERDRRPAIEKVREFLERFFETDADNENARHLHLCANQGEYEQLRRPLPAFSQKRLKYTALKIGIQTGGRLSTGIRLGLRCGFDSGSSLDYVYRNRASGMTLCGWLIDRAYLNSVGWRGIRERKVNLERALHSAMSLLRKRGMTVRIVDIAAGFGRYVLDAIDSDKFGVESVLLRDYSDKNIELGRRLVQERGLDRVVRFDKGDAFDRASLAEIKPKMTIGIVSGLYELFPENEPVRASLAGLADAIASGGLMIYTCQPFHPQLELIARTLPNREGQPWIMRRRTQAEMDRLVGEAGFRKIEQWIDDEGMFSVSLAERL